MKELKCKIARRKENGRKTFMILHYINLEDLTPKICYTKENIDEFSFIEKLMLLLI